MKISPGVFRVFVDYAAMQQSLHVLFVLRACLGPGPRADFKAAGRVPGAGVLAGSNSGRIYNRFP
jgi:hypothetical protein